VFVPGDPVEHGEFNALPALPRGPMMNGFRLEQCKHSDRRLIFSLELSANAASEITLTAMVGASATRRQRPPPELVFGVPIHRRFYRIA